ncbi:SCO6880 family protein [Leucobacter chinensis]|uniref:SCO6880 family protein n=1 Tax=Leucobacter chinensis TaxID=2851010 RepID=UPI001C2510B1|nr:SCO6880 family protein [Leucobacter chinensis]
MTENYVSQPMSFSRLPSQGLVYGISGVGFVGLAIAAVLTGIMVIAKGLLVALLFVPFTGGLAALSLLKMYGEPLLSHVGREVGGNMRKMLGATKYRARPESKKVEPEAALDIPGRKGRLFVYETETGACVVWDALKQTATITCVVATAGMGLPQVGVPSTLSEGERDWLIFEWAKVLGSFTQKEHIVRVTTLEQTRPGTVAAEQRYFDERNKQGTAAQASYLEALELAREQVVLHRTQLAITLRLKGHVNELVKGYGGGKRGMLKLAELEMETVHEALMQAGFSRVAWITGREWGAWGRSIIDPASQEAVDVRLGTEHEGVAPHAATPMVFEEHRNFVETDSAWHRTLWVHEWPRYDTYPGFMSRLVMNRPQNGKPVRHTLMLAASPVPIGKAMKRLEDEKRTWITNQNLRHKAGKPESAADEADWHAIAAHERDLVEGQGELRFSAFITVTATDEESLEREVASIVSACAATGLEPRLVPWQQGEALLNIAYPCGEGMK